MTRAPDKILVGKVWRVEDGPATATDLYVYDDQDIDDDVAEWALNRHYKTGNELLYIDDNTAFAVERIDGVIGYYTVLAENVLSAKADEVDADNADVAAALAYFGRICPYDG